MSGISASTRQRSRGSTPKPSFPDERDWVTPSRWTQASEYTSRQRTLGSERALFYEQFSDVTFLDFEHHLILRSTTYPNAFSKRLSKWAIASYSEPFTIFSLQVEFLGGHLVLKLTQYEHARQDSETLEDLVCNFHPTRKEPLTKSSAFIFSSINTSTPRDRCDFRRYICLAVSASEHVFKNSIFLRSIPEMYIYHDVTCTVLIKLIDFCR